MPQPKKPAVKSAKAVSVKPNGTFMAFPNGRLARTRPIYKDIADMESIDTTGYSKGKKDFTLTTASNTYKNVNNKNVSRKDVPSVIAGLKKGATRFEDYRTAAQKKKK
jgi:hypothetical protein